MCLILSLFFVCCFNGIFIFMNIDDHLFLLRKIQVSLFLIMLYLSDTSFRSIRVFRAISNAHIVVLKWVKSASHMLYMIVLPNELLELAKIRISKSFSCHFLMIFLLVFLLTLFNSSSNLFLCFIELADYLFKIAR